MCANRAVTPSMPRSGFRNESDRGMQSPSPSPWCREFLWRHDGIEFGLPTAPGATNALPETRPTPLIKVAYQDELKLYFQLTDSAGKTLRCYSVGACSPSVRRRRNWTSLTTCIALADRREGFNLSRLVSNGNFCCGKRRSTRNAPQAQGQRQRQCLPSSAEQIVFPKRHPSPTGEAAGIAGVEKLAPSAFASRFWPFRKERRRTYPSPQSRMASS